MINITAEETKIIRSKFPNVHIRRTTNKYYMEENKKAMDFLKRLNNNKR